MGTPQAGKDLLSTWISKSRSDFMPHCSTSFEATVAGSSISKVAVREGTVSFEVAVSPPLLNNYGTLNGGCQAALSLMAAELALRSRSEMTMVAVSSSTDHLSAAPALEPVIFTAAASSGEAQQLEQHFHAPSFQPLPVPFATSSSTE